ncbi:Arm DNA-binding domain-containing protein [Flavivirga sp. 57AJ16]|uniref:Arm DNA-binding domain-containing protein n=1 Tax=Flavivirga sp. 57AJ16 TaxID=3025307 RepID=UPI002365D8F2|nr:Arm DNA-binding domain-containing protein [Flavivirga sp. 57AJ16]MDD7886787.1 Arm DNA-binding domain-containing protein [Flavivirga sp. 57AJ16]
MASSIKIVLIKKKNKDVLYPLAVRFTKNRQSTYRYLGHYIKLSDWDSKNRQVKSAHPNSGILNKLISSEFKKANRGLIKFQAKQKEFSSFLGGGGTI